MLKAKSDSTRSLLGTSIGHFLNDGANNLFPAVYPVLLKSYNVSLEFIGFLAALYSLSSLIASPFIGRRSDYNESYLRIIPLGLIVVAFGILGFALSTAFFPRNLLYFGLVLFTLLAGFGSSFYHPIAAAILNETWSLESRGRAMGINGSMGGVGTLAFPIITVGLIVLFGVKSLSLVAIAFILLAIAIYLIMRRIAAPEHPKNVETGDRKTSPGVSLRIVLPTVLALTLAGFFRRVMTQGVLNFLPTYLNTVSKIPYEYVGSVEVAYAFFAIVGQPLFGSLSDRYGRKAMIGVTLLGCVGSVFLLSESSTNFWLTEFSLGLFGLFSYTGFPLFLGLTGLIAPKGGITLANSIVWGFGMIGGATLGPILVGVLSEPAFLGSLNLAFLSLSGIGAISLAFLPFIPNPKSSVISA
ncbi:MAG TPA: MFS transporter [Nitrososphaerales archaeon]|nr:MFS transporter [Nitrososphaerales archaeon]